MYKVYIVDDERIALDDLVRNLPWAEFGFQVVGRETNPLVAVHEIKKIPVDVVFTDIRMPGINGLELIKQLAQSGCKPVFVIVSAYDDFTYVRKALQLNSFDYIIKPVTAEVGAELFDRLHARLNNIKGPPVNRPLTSSTELNHITEFIDRNITHKLTLADLGEKFNISPNHICTLFSKHMNTTFLNYILSARMAIAQNLLTMTDKPVKEIAALSGYDDYFYFCKVFRKYFQMTPTGMRQGD